MTVDEMLVPPATVLEFRGRFRACFDRWVEVPFDVPAGVGRISVEIGHDRYPRLGASVRNVMDLGIFGPGSGAAGFRGWSGGARTRFTLAATDATPGYLPGPIQPGRWRVVLGPVALNPFGMAWRLRVALEHGDDGGVVPAPAPPALAVPGAGPGWYRGDLHLHSVHSDGGRDLDELAAAARVAKLDFIVSTEHNTNSANRVWGAHEPDGLLVVAGEEVTTRHGHWLAVGLPPGGWVDWRYTPRSGDFARVAARVRDEGGLVVAAHPAVPVPGSAWRYGYRQVDAIEVWNGRWNVDDEVSLRIWQALLRRGRRVVAVAGSDSHGPHQPVGCPQTVVHAAALATSAIVAAVREGRAYLAASSEVGVDLTASVAGPGGSVAGPGGSVAGPGGTVAVPPGGSRYGPPSPARPRPGSPSSPPPGRWRGRPSTVAVWAR